jgi:spermidine synthase
MHNKRALDGYERQPALVQTVLRLLLLVAFGMFTLTALVPLVSNIRDQTPWTTLIVVQAIVLVCLSGAEIWAFKYLLRRLTPFIDSTARAQADFLDAFNSNRVDLAILLSAALSLFLELSVIRWQSTTLPFFAFYKNFSLLACFIGLGVGYALATRDRIPLSLVIPVLALQFAFMTFGRFGGGMTTSLPFREQLTMGQSLTSLPTAVYLYGLLTLVFLVTALAFLPVGQLCGRLMERRKKLRAYGLNLLGSLLGVLIMLAASFLWTPPLIWFGLSFLAILMLNLRTKASLLVGIAFTLLCMIILAWPADPLWNRIYSPYQLLEVGYDQDTGLTLIRAAGTYYQKIHNFSSDVVSGRQSQTRAYYDFPYKTHAPLAKVAVVGAGTGNDVAASLRAGAGHVEAIEIDPAILLVGKTAHPEKPYSDPRVHAVINDARSFFRQTDQKFDLIVYGLLDSHTLLSHGSSVRIDSFVYTVEGLREARSRLKSDGVLSLSFSMLGDNLGRKIYLMLEQAFDGRPPVCVSGVYDGSVLFLESNDPQWSLPSKLLDGTGLTSRTALYANSLLRADVSTDDWPFFYMPQRVYPVSYLVMVVQILVLSGFFAGNFVSQQLKLSHLSFFFLGAGFMLVETKGITELGLTFGNTWQVIGFVIGGILVMAFLGNCVVQWLNIQRPQIPYMLLLATLAVGWSVAKSGGLASTPLGRLETCVVLTCPLFFSGIVFSTMMTSKGAVSGIMATNLLGAIFGGLLEYNSMYFGFRSLYVVAMGCYIFAFISEWAFQRRQASAVQSAVAVDALEKMIQ